MTKSPHIVVAVTNDLSSDQRMHRTCTALVEAGYRVTLVGRQLPASRPLDKRLYDCHRLLPAATAGPMMYGSYNWLLYRYIAQIQPDACIAVDLDTVLAIQRSCRLLSIPYVFDAHEYYTEVPELQGHPIKKAIWYRVGRMAIADAASCITVNESLAEILGDKYDRSFSVVRNVPIASDAVVDSPANPRRLIYQGVLNTGRWIEHYIDIMDRVPIDLELHLYGAGDVESEVREKVRNSSSCERIYIHGYTPPAQLKKETAKGWLGLNMLDDTSLNYRYSLANKFFDYMHAGIPSINSNLPEYQRLLEQHEVGLAIRNHIDTLAETINDLHHNPEAYDRLRLQALTAAPYHAWEEERKIMLKIVERLFK